MYSKPAVRATGDDPILKVDLGNPVPVYRQIVDALRALLVQGAFRPGERLPTVRQMAIDLTVNHNTVAEAYRVLSEEGWLQLRRFHGATVLARRDLTANSEQHDEFAQRLRELVARAISDGLDTGRVAAKLTRLAQDLGKKGR